MEHSRPDLRRVVKELTLPQLVECLKYKRDTVVVGERVNGYVERNPLFKELLNDVFAKSVVANEGPEGCVVVLDHTDFNTTSTMVGEGVKLADIRVPNSFHGNEMKKNADYGSAVTPLGLVEYIRGEEGPIRAMYADLCGTVDEAKEVINALVETRRLAKGALLMVTICERSKVDSGLSGGRDQSTDLAEMLQPLGTYKKVKEGCVDYGAGARMATYTWRIS